ncbi:hypothetical protein [Aquibacillus sediminis]|uniref:hypothetical protein n=1 Tax=Aquibacillus sediminis TaxID=2574734 RepID=UPI001109D6C5|nr:hypothetical protein [Aquibacillus sediminis]
MSLPAIDVSLMNEHLSTHKGQLHKLKQYYQQIRDPYIKQITNAQTIIMENHVDVMLSLLDPYHNHWVQVIPLQQVFNQLQLNQASPIKQPSDKSIVLELHSTAKFMANNNFLSALMMKNDNVKQVHYEMATQQANFEKIYSDYIKHMEWSVTTHVDDDEQLKIINHFQQ